MGDINTIIAKNLFEPSRGFVKATEGGSNVAGVQRLRSIVLQGTAIVGDDRYALLEIPIDSRLTAVRSRTPEPLQLLRVKLGDAVEGFRLSEIQERRVIFLQGDSRVEIGLDYLRKIEEPREKAPVRRPAVAIPPIPSARPPRSEATPEEPKE